MYRNGPSQLNWGMLGWVGFTMVTSARHPEIPYLNIYQISWNLINTYQELIFFIFKCGDSNNHIISAFYSPLLGNMLAHRWKNLGGEHEPLKNCHPCKTLTSEKYSPLKNICPEKYSSLKNIHHWKIFTLKIFAPEKYPLCPPCSCSPCPLSMSTISMNGRVCVVLGVKGGRKRWNWRRNVTIGTDERTREYVGPTQSMDTVRLSFATALLASLPLTSALGGWCQLCSDEISQQEKQI